MANLLLGEYSKNNYLVANSMFGKDTCTDIGPSWMHHFAWRFHPRSVSAQPNWFVYLSLISVSFYHYVKDIYTISSSWVISLGLTYALIQSSTEIPSVWCMFSVMGTLFIVLKDVFDYVKEKYY